MNGFQLLYIIHFYIILFFKYNQFEWDEYQQNAILGAFFTMHMVMQIPGGVLAQRYGTKKVFGISNGLSSLLSIGIPISAKINYQSLVGIRLVQGFIAVRFFV